MRLVVGVQGLPTLHHLDRLDKAFVPSGLTHTIDISIAPKFLPAFTSLHLSLERASQSRGVILLKLVK